MSADNWTVCPKCFMEWENEISDLEYSIEKQYGKIPADAYLELVSKRDDLMTKELQETFREDYEIHMYSYGGGTLHIRYKGMCEKCGYIREFSVDDAGEK